MNNRIVYKLAILANGCNPNGDPNNDNQPRQLMDGRGLITGECIRRKIVTAMLNAGINVCKQKSDEESGYQSLLDAVEKNVDKALFWDKKTDDKVRRKLICDVFPDVRAFGCLFTGTNTKGGKKLALGIRGAVSIQDAVSIEPISVESMTITKCYNNDNLEGKKKDGEEDSDKSEKGSSTMGMKHRVYNAVYVANGAINPVAATHNGLTEQDIKNVELAMVRMFDDDSSAARPVGSLKLTLVKIERPDELPVSNVQVLDWISVNNDGTMCEHIPEEWRDKVSLTVLSKIAN